MENKKISELTLTKATIKKSHLKYYRKSLLIVSVLFLISGLIINIIAPELYDPIVLRVMLAIPFLMVYIFSFTLKYVKEKFIFFFNGCLTMILLWALFIADANNYSFVTTIIFILVASINTAAVGKSKFIPFYTSFIFIIIIPFFLISGIDYALGFSIVLSIAVVHFVTYLVLKSKEETEKSLIESEKRVSHLVHALGEGIGIIGNDDVFLFTNPSANEIFEVDSEEIIGHPISKFYSGSCNQFFTNRPRITNTHVSNTFEIIILTPQKKCKTLLVTETSYNLTQQNLQGSILVFRDISKRIKAEKELEKAKDKAEESDKLKSAFLANMSHEIRTPMNSILGFADLLKMPQLSTEEQHLYIDIIQKSGTRMLNIINDIIDISKVEAGLMEVIIENTNINEHIDSIYHSFIPEVDAKGIQFSFNKMIVENEFIIQTDAHKVDAILVNLVKNAIKYTQKGSIEFGYFFDNENQLSNSVTFYVKDTGIGIPLCRQEAIFERFVQADIEDRNAYQGAGLGLSISKAYVELLGGTIWVESQDGIGSTFFFTIPYKTNNNSTYNKKNKFRTDLSEKEMAISGLTILIVEDDQYSEMLISNIVNGSNNEIIKVIDGHEAVEICQNRADIDLILMDIRLSTLNGYEATKRIRAFNKDVIIIAQTAFGLTGDREKAIEAGCNDYIAKPINSDELIALIKKNRK